MLAFTNPTLNSYHRLVKGYEAPVNLVYSAGNRSAAIRIPITGTNPKAKRIEFRAPDASGNPYLAFAAQLMAGLDGIKNRIEPHEPVDKDLYELPPEEAKNIPQVPNSLQDSLDALAADHEFLLAGGVFTPELIETWIEYKIENEIKPLAARPHPFEYELYYGVVVRSSTARGAPGTGAPLRAVTECAGIRRGASRSPLAWPDVAVPGRQPPGGSEVRPAAGTPRDRRRDAAALLDHPRRSGPVRSGPRGSRQERLAKELTIEGAARRAGCGHRVPTWIRRRPSPAERARSGRDRGRRAWSCSASSPRSPMKHCATVVHDWSVSGNAGPYRRRVERLAGPVLLDRCLDRGGGGGAHSRSRMRRRGDSLSAASPSTPRAPRRG